MPCFHLEPGFYSCFTGNSQWHMDHQHFCTISGRLHMRWSRHYQKKKITVLLSTALKPSGNDWMCPVLPWEGQLAAQSRGNGHHVIALCLYRCDLSVNLSLFSPALPTLATGARCGAVPAAAPARQNSGQLRLRLPYGLSCPCAAHGHLPDGATSHSVWPRSAAPWQLAVNTLLTWEFDAHRSRYTDDDLLIYS